MSNKLNNVINNKRGNFNIYDENLVHKLIYVNYNKFYIGNNNKLILKQNETTLVVHP